MFGVGNLRALDHMAVIMRARKALAADGTDSYVSHPERLRLPILMVQGERNYIFRPEGSLRTLRWLQGANDPALYERVVLPGYAHLDALIGRDAPADVFPVRQRPPRPLQPLSRVKQARLLAGPSGTFQTCAMGLPQDPTRRGVPGHAGDPDPDQRLRVFVSSTLGELADERVAVSRAITALRLTPVLFELGARPYPPQAVYRAYLAQSDIFIGLYWQRYGWIGPDMAISGLEDEFELSRSLPRLLYVKAPAPDREPRLAELLDRVKSEASDSYRTFGTARELGRLVRDDLAVLLSERFAAARAAEPTSSPLRARRRRRSMPVGATSLIGRERDIDELCGLVEHPDVRLVTLTGPGGIGKSRLVVDVGERLGDSTRRGRSSSRSRRSRDPSSCSRRRSRGRGQPGKDAVAAGRPRRVLR